MNINRNVNRMRFAGVMFALMAGLWFGGHNKMAVVPAKDTTQLKDEAHLDETLAQRVKRIHLETRSFGDFK